MDAISQTTSSSAISWMQMFVPKGLIYNIPALVWIKAWRRPGDKPLSEPMMVRLPTHICVARPQWVKGSDTSTGWLVDPSAKSIGNSPKDNFTTINQIMSLQWFCKFAYFFYYEFISICCRYRSCCGGHHPPGLPICHDRLRGWAWLHQDRYTHLGELQISGSWFNIKMSYYQCKKYHCGDNTFIRFSYLHTGISYTGNLVLNQPPWSYCCSWLYCWIVPLSLPLFLFSLILIEDITHRGRDKMAAIFQMTFSNAFSWMKMW